jgi:hypothetical protein
MFSFLIYWVALSLIVCLYRVCVTMCAQNSCPINAREWFTSVLFHS